MKDITGLRFGKLVAIKPVKKPDERKTNGVYWLCQCDCGNTVIVNGITLRQGYTKSCGCLRVNSHNASRKHFGCMNCGSDKHYAKGYCVNCYGKFRRGTLE